MTPSNPPKMPNYLAKQSLKNINLKNLFIGYLGENHLRFTSYIF